MPQGFALRACDVPFKQLIETTRTKYKPFVYKGDDLPPIGVELEAVAPLKYSKSDVAKEILEYLRASLKADPAVKVAPEVAVRNGRYFNTREYVASYTRGKETFEIKVVHDGSIAAPEGYHGFEIVSPILRSKDDYEIYRDAIQHLRKAVKLKPEPHSAGLHVHVDFKNFRKSELSVLTMTFLLIEKRLENLFMPTRERRGHTKNVLEQFLEVFEEDSQPLSYPNRKLEGDHEERYFNLNLLSLLDHGTVEFRMFNSTVDPFVMDSIADFCQKFVHAIRTQNEPLFTYIKNTPPSKIQVARISEILGLTMTGQQRKLMNRINKEVDQEIEPILARVAPPVRPPAPVVAPATATVPEPVAAPVANPARAIEPPPASRPVREPDQVAVAEPVRPREPEAPRHSPPAPMEPVTYRDADYDVLVRLLKIGAGSFVAYGLWRALFGEGDEEANRRLDEEFGK